MHPGPSTVLLVAARAVLEELALVDDFVSLPRIIPWSSKVEITSDEEVIAYREGITGNHLAVGGIERMIIPLHASSPICVPLRLSTAIFRILSNLTCS